MSNLYLFDTNLIFVYYAKMGLFILSVIYPILTLVAIFVIIRINASSQETILKTILSIEGKEAGYIQLDSYNRAQARQKQLDKEAKDKAKKDAKKKQDEPQGMQIF